MSNNVNNNLHKNVSKNGSLQTSSSKRLNKYISDSGFSSRRGADKLIEENRVTINGKIPELGTKVFAGDVVKVDGKTINASADNKSDRIYIAYHKPVGITCTTELHVRGNIIDAINHRSRIFPIGRLDKPSEGLIFLTSDGDIVNKILRAENAHDKEYLVTVDKPLSERFVERMERGVPILGTITKPCKVNVKSRFVFTIVLTQGLNRQIRRMCEYLGYDVIKLKRTRIMSVNLQGLKVGQWRDLTSQEMDEINAAVATSSKTAVEVEIPENKKRERETVRTEHKPAHDNLLSKHSTNENSLSNHSPYKDSPYANSPNELSSNEASHHKHSLNKPSPNKEVPNNVNESLNIDSDKNIDENLNEIANKNVYEVKKTEKVMVPEKYQLNKTKSAAKKSNKRVLSLKK